LHRRSQRPVKSLHFPLRLRMPVPAAVQPYSLLHQPHRQPRPSHHRLHVPPRCPVVHQHLFGHTASLERFDQLPLYGFGSRRPRPSQRDRVPAVIVQQRQRPPRGVPFQRAFEIHLPHLVRCCTLKPPHRSPVAIFSSHQPVPQQNPMHRDH